MANKVPDPTGVRASKFAKEYVALVEALMREGVAEEIARDEARATALMLVVGDEATEGGRACPLCGRGGEG